MRTVPQALTHIEFKGVCDYLEDLVARIDAPRLIMLYITFFNDFVFDIPQFMQFSNRTPTLKSLEKARVAFGNDAAEVNLLSKTSDFGELKVKISCRGIDWQILSLK